MEHASVGSGPIVIVAHQAAQLLGAGKHHRVAVLDNSQGDGVAKGNEFDESSAKCHLVVTGVDAAELGAKRSVALIENPDTRRTTS